MSAEALSNPLFDRAPLKAIVERANIAIRTGTGFSLIRLGDGEGPIMWWPDRQTPDQIPEVLETWFGRHDIAAPDLTAIADGLRQATRTADVLGLPTRYLLTLTPRYGMALNGVDHYGLYSRSQLLTDTGVHWYLQWSGALKRLLHGLDVLHVISCRDIGTRIAVAFNIKSVETYLVRGEHRFPGPETRAHWPDGFREVMQKLDSVRPGEVFLVGAGVLGKIYCDRIKRGQGIALDIGSILDSWANVPSRQRYKSGSKAFTLEHFDQVGGDWDTMLSTLDRCAKDYYADDTTTTY